jgi:hypothetical protein
MQADYYRSQANLVPTFSLVLAVSLGGLNMAIRPEIASTPIASFMKGSANIYYHPLERANGEEALRRFAKSLFSKTEDSPQEIVDLVNKHFWDLV